METRFIPRFPLGVSPRCGGVKLAKHARHTARFSGGRIAVIAAALAVVLAFSVGGSYAYLTYTTNSETNTLSAGNVSIEVVETDANGQEIATNNGAAQVALGQTAKNISVKNTSSVPVYVRISFVPEIEETFVDEESKTEQKANTFMDEDWPDSFNDTSLTDTSLTVGVVTLYFANGWTNSWTYNNGAFVSKAAVAPGATIGPLLTGVDWSTEATDEQKTEDTLRVNAFAEAIQQAAKDEWNIS